MTVPAMPAVFHHPGFWRGAAAARRELLERCCCQDDEARLRFHAWIGMHEAIAEALAAKTPLFNIPEFAGWLQTIHRTPPNAPDFLSIVR